MKLTRKCAALALGFALLFSYVLSSCQREDGLPDPPLRTLVPCVPDAAEDDPLVCPAEPVEVDAGSAELGTSDDQSSMYD